MKILRVIGSLDPATGGPGQGIRNITPFLSSRGIETDIVTLDDPAASYIASSELPIIPLGPATGIWKRSQRLFEWLVENILNYNAVIVHGLWLYHAYAARCALEQIGSNIRDDAKPKLYFMPHGMLDPYFQKAPSRRLKALRNWLYWKAIESRNIQAATAVLFTSEEEMLAARKAFLPYAPNEKIIGYGIPDCPTVISSQVTDFQEKFPEIKWGKYLLFLSRIDVKKGIDLLIKIYAELLDSGIDLPQLVVAGPLDGSFAIDLVREVSGNSKLVSKVIFTGILRDENKWCAFAGAEAFILPSHQENFGIAVVEALSAGVPVLTTDKVNIYREISDFQAGLIGSDDREGIKGLVLKWIELHQKSRDELALNARSCYEKFYQVKNVAEILIDVLQNK